MILSKNVVETYRTADGGYSTELIWRLINQHEAEKPRLNMLYDYYTGKHRIIDRVKDDEYAANNRTVMNFPKYISTMATSFFVGDGITYAVDDEYTIDDVMAEYDRQSIEDLDAELADSTSVYGKAYELVYVDEFANVKSCKLPVCNAFIVYNSNAEMSKLFALHYYCEQDINGNILKSIAVIYDDKFKIVYESEGATYSSLREVERTEHFFGAVPMIEYRNNEEEQSDFESSIPDIDAYNVMMSDRVNSTEDFVNSFLLLTGIDVDSEQAAKLKQERILLGDEGGSGKYLSQALSEADTEILRNAIKSDIHTQSLVPDLTDETFANNLSGVAIRYKLYGLKVLANTKKKYFRKSLLERFSLYQSILNIKRNTPILPLHELDIIFHFTELTNDTEIADMVAKLNGIVSSETLLDTLPFVIDAKDEAEKVKEEQAEKLKITDNIYSVNKYVPAEGKDEDEEQEILDKTSEGVRASEEQGD